MLQLNAAGDLDDYPAIESTPRFVLRIDVGFLPS